MITRPSTDLREPSWHKIFIVYINTIISPLIHINSITTSVSLEHGYGPLSYKTWVPILHFTQRSCQSFCVPYRNATPLSESQTSLDMHPLSRVNMNASPLALHEQKYQSSVSHRHKCQSYVLHKQKCHSSVSHEQKFQSSASDTQKCQFSALHKQKCQPYFSHEKKCQSPLTHKHGYPFTRSCHNERQCSLLYW